MIYILDNCIDKDFCKNCIKFYKYAKWLRQEAKVTSEKDGGSIIPNIRKSEYIRFFPNSFKEETKEIYSIIYNYAVNSFNFKLFPLENMHEDIKIIKYKKGDHFNWHYDCFHETTKTRKINFSIQLSDEDDYDGGDLEFFNLDINKNRKIGTVILYPAFLPHRINTVTKGIRYSIVGHLNGPEFQ
jgi:PKHD-type hydroxylase